MEILKTTMADMEEKVQYQSEERVRDLHEMLENCHTRVRGGGGGDGFVKNIKNTFLHSSKTKKINPS